MALQARDTHHINAPDVSLQEINSKLQKHNPASQETYGLAYGN